MNVYQDWGEPHSLKGQMACFMMFEEPLEPEKVKELHKQGMNQWHLLNAKHDEGSSNMPKTIMHVDAKAMCDGNLMYVDGVNIGFAKCHNTRICHSWNMQETIHTMGGLSVLFPLIEPDETVSLTIDNDD